MATYTTTADANGDFQINFPIAWNGGQKTTITATKDAVSRSIEIHAPSGVVGGGLFEISGSASSYPANIGEITYSTDVASFNAGVGSSYPFSEEGRYATGLHFLGSILSLPANRFRSWTEITKLTLPSTLETIGNACFRGCSKLLKIKLNDSVKTISSEAFRDCSAATEIDFSEATQLQEIQGSAFYGCTSNVGELVFPETLTTLGGSAFINNKPSKIDLSACDLLASIGDSAFSGANNPLGCEVLLPPNLVSIGSNAFNGLTASSIDLPATLTTIGTSAFEGSNITSLVLPALVSSLSASAFRSITLCKSVTFLGTALTEISSYCFRYAGFDTPVVIPSGVTSIGSYGLAGMASCPKIELPSTLESMGTYALSNNSALAELVLHSTTPPSINASNTLQNLPSSCIIKVPAASLSAYQSASGWSSKASQMVGI